MDKKEKVAAVLAKLNKDHGKGTVGVYGSMERIDVDVIPTGSLGLDTALGVGGYPRGRIIEIWGPEASGKTTMTLHAIAEAQARDGLCAFIDAEHALDPAYATALGVDMDALVLSQPDTGEQALQIADELVETGAFDIIVIDSVAALVPKAEIEGEMGDTHVGLQARLMSQALRKLKGTVSRSKTVLYFVNQNRMKIGVKYGSPETTSGGNALKYYASVRLDIRRISGIKKTIDGKETDIGNRIKIKVAKNKVSPPFRTCEFDILFGQGVNKAGELIDAALMLELDEVEKSGAWYTILGERAQGRDNACNLLRENEALMEKLETKIRMELRLPCE